MHKLILRAFERGKKVISEVEKGNQRWFEENGFTGHIERAEVAGYPYLTKGYPRVQNQFLHESLAIHRASSGAPAKIRSIGHTVVLGHDLLDRVCVSKNPGAEHEIQVISHEVPDEQVLFGGNSLNLDVDAIRAALHAKGFKTEVKSDELYVDVKISKDGEDVGEISHEIEKSFSMRFKEKHAKSLIKLLFSQQNKNLLSLRPAGS